MAVEVSLIVVTIAVVRLFVGFPPEFEDIQRRNPVVELDAQVLCHLGVHQSGSGDFSEGALLGHQGIAASPDEHCALQLRMKPDVIAEFARLVVDGALVGGGQSVRHVVEDHALGAKAVHCILSGALHVNSGLELLLFQFVGCAAGQAQALDKAGNGEPLNQQGEEHHSEGHDHNGSHVFSTSHLPEFSIVLDGQRKSQRDGSSETTPVHDVLVAPWDLSARHRGLVAPDSP